MSFNGSGSWPTKASCGKFRFDLKDGAVSHLHAIFEYLVQSRLGVMPPTGTIDGSDKFTTAFPVAQTSDRRRNLPTPSRINSTSTLVSASGGRVDALIQPPPMAAEASYHLRADRDGFWFVGGGGHGPSCCCSFWTRATSDV